MLTKTAAIVAVVAAIYGLSAYTQSHAQSPAPTPGANQVAQQRLIHTDTEARLAPAPGQHGPVAGGDSEPFNGRHDSREPLTAVAGGEGEPIIGRNSNRKGFTVVAGGDSEPFQG